MGLLLLAASFAHGSVPMLRPIKSRPLTTLVCLLVAIAIVRLRACALPRRFVTRLILESRSPLFHLALFALGTASCSAVSWLFLGGLPRIDDEVAAVFQARIFSQGAFVLPLPAAPEFFELFGVLGGRPGWATGAACIRRVVPAARAGRRLRGALACQPRPRRLVAGRHLPPGRRALRPQDRAPRGPPRPLRADSRRQWRQAPPPGPRAAGASRSGRGCGRIGDPGGRWHLARLSRFSGGPAGPFLTGERRLHLFLHTPGLVAPSSKRARPCGRACGSSISASALWAPQRSILGRVSAPAYAPRYAIVGSP